MGNPYRLIIWGAGNEYATVADAIFSLVEKGQGEVLGIMADSLPATGTLDGFRILSKDALHELDFDILLVCVGVGAEEVIRSICETYAVSRERILHSGVMRQPRFDFAQYMRLRESGVSIIANMCWGGALYKRLGLRCMSPFRDLYLTDENYLRLLGNMKDYCSMTPAFSRFDRDSFGTRHPVMALDDVELHFNHVETPEEATCQWNKRVDRINWDNLFVMMQTSRKASELQFNALDRYQKKICFVPYETDAPHSMQIHHSSSGTSFFETVLSTAHTPANSFAFDPIRLLLGEPDYLRYIPSEDLGVSAS